MAGYYTQIKERDARIAELEQQLAAAQAELASRDAWVRTADAPNPPDGYYVVEYDQPGGPVYRTARKCKAGDWFNPNDEQFIGHLYIPTDTPDRYLKHYPRDAWVRTADRMPTEADADAGGDVIWWSQYNGPVPGNWKSKASWRTHWRALPAPPADDEGGDDERS